MRVQVYPIEISFVHKDSLKTYLERTYAGYLRNWEKRKGDVWKRAESAGTF